MTRYGELETRLRATAMQRRIPVHAALCLTHRCNLDCLHCYLRDDRGRPELSSAEWCALVDEAAELGCLWLTLTGGEPTLRPDFPEIYRHAKRRGLLVVVMTNGTLLDERLLALLADWPPHYLDISLYAYSPEPYRRLTGRDVRDRVYATLDELLARRIRVRVKTAVTRENVDEVPAIARWARERALDYRVDGDLCPTLQGDPSVQDLAASRSERDHLSQTYSHRPQPGGCGAAQTGFYITPAGGIAACVLDAPMTHWSPGRGDLATAWEASLRVRRAAIGGPRRSPDCVPLAALGGGLEARNAG